MNVKNSFSIPSTLGRWLGVVTVLLLGTFSLKAEFGGLRDNAGFFSEPAKAEASRNIGEIGKRFKKDLVIETFNTIPEDLTKGVDLQDKAALNRLFEQWAVKLAREQRVNGVYILMSKEPAHLQVLVGNETQRRAFSPKDRDVLVSAMVAKLRNKQNDAALLDAVSFVSSTMKSHAVARAGTPALAVTQTDAEKSSAWSWVLPALIGLVLAWVVVAVFRALFSGGNAGGGMLSSGMGGGGFFSSLLGGMFGAAAGMWLYDTLSGHHGTAHAAEADDRGNTDSGFSGQDTDYAGSGDSIGGNSSGGDFGGDAGGGDFGGGDSGGGDF